MREGIHCAKSPDQLTSLLVVCTWILSVPVGLIDSSLGGSSIQPWCAPEGLATEPTEMSYYQDRLDPEKSKIVKSGRGHLNGEVGLYETFIHPLKGYVMRGMILASGGVQRQLCSL